ncbi:vanadium-dependent haloperoxidase [Solirubrobacter sp. CPCC 204708]|uniref:Vanadium-dependent haloperoxidase n=1 Tax=Solirubrobacter deserti TaxID=2282478 RepID=A0ABT4RMN5_9ACTN|nr:vanadium-dependent haloperoxidase [Solirubrobacter deserti]MBE2318014.1 vanadium-dependent haloperoxidase [Solirubrobacter deserti]MDA0139693.1 vanadium-dependent haloperoxidase [Solirubrobacter deserti]
MTQRKRRRRRLFALVSAGMADAAIAAWDLKFLTPVDLWRPSTAIHNAASVGNAGTQADTNWRPLSHDRNGVSFDPCFPAYVSGHATFGGAWSRVLEDEFSGTDYTNPFPLTLTTEDPHATLAPPAVGFVTRSFDSFTEAAEENALSRIWLGVHYRIDATGGLATGRSVATDVGASALRWTQKCAGWTCGEAIP